MCTYGIIGHPDKACSVKCFAFEAASRGPCQAPNSQKVPTAEPLPTSLLLHIVLRLTSLNLSTVVCHGGSLFILSDNLLPQVNMSIRVLVYIYTPANDGCSGKLVQIGMTGHKDDNEREIS